MTAVLTSDWSRACRWRTSPPPRTSSCAPSPSGRSTWRCRTRSSPPTSRGQPSTLKHNHNQSLCFSRYLNGINNKLTKEPTIFERATIEGKSHGDDKFVSCWGGLGSSYCFPQGDRDYLTRLLQDRRESLSK